MTKALYVSIFEVNELQTKIMIFVDRWVRKEKIPVPQREIIDYMKKQGIKDFTVVNALNSLLTKRYIRRAFMISNKTCYVQLRRVVENG